jgi:membrane protein YdbS with pleckstrin-like domain
MNRLHPRIRLLWIGRSVLSAAVLSGLFAGVLWYFTISQLPLWSPAVVFIAVAVLGIAISSLRYRIWRFEVRDDALYLRRGVFTQVRTVVPFVRIQHVDTRRSPVERSTGLASTVVYTAGSRGADVSVPGLAREQANELRERLRTLAIQSEGEDAV